MIIRQTVALIGVILTAIMLSLLGCVENSIPSSSEIHVIPTSQSVAGVTDDSLQLLADIAEEWWVYETADDLSPESRPIIKISPDVIQGQGFCNGFGMDISMNADGLVSVGRFTQTLIGCGEEGNAEEKFFKHLVQIRHIEVNNEELVLSGLSTSLVFRKYENQNDERLFRTPDPTLELPPVISPSGEFTPSPYP